ncbi:AAA family ATPase [Candidatus Nomurabacteria bacterium]|nr:AAA family ATPase [Candidatus Nomurabacteria bacterium]
MDRITIFGVSGSGKSTLANELGKKLDLPVVHLDKLYWTKDWKEVYSTKMEFKNAVEPFVKQDKWIIDGNYKKTLPSRLERADVIIFFDFPKWRCVWRAFVRIFNTDKPFDKPDGAKQKISFDLIKYILLWPNKEMLVLAESYKDTKQVFIVHNNKEIKETLSKMC